MPRSNFVNSLLQAANKPNRQNPWLIAIDLLLPTPDGPLYLVRNNEEIVWDGITYIPMWFQLDAINVRAGEIPKISITYFRDASFVEYENKYSGFVGQTLILSFVFVTYNSTSGQWEPVQGKTDYPLSFTFDVTGLSVTSITGSLVLGTPNYFNTKFPQTTYYKNMCPFIYKGPYCWMKDFTEDTGEPTSCGHRYEDCKEHWTYQKNKLGSEPTEGVGFGGFPSIGEGQYIY